ncbi:MAG: hypothetical protein JO356_10365 [Acidobacteria bacterium]|nr:hypothetical protein [Acidobacteriota bacterium]
MHDDAGTTLSQISFLSEIARNEVLAHPRQAELLLTQIGELSRDLANSMAEIVWALNPQQDRMEDLISYFRRFANDLFEPSAIDFEFVVGSESQQAMRLRADIKRQTFLVFKELLTNILKHSDCQRVRAEIYIENHTLHLNVEDDGVGFDTAQRAAGNGIGNMRRRATSLGGSLAISSTPGSGTRACLRLPIKERGLIRYLNR